MTNEWLNYHHLFYFWSVAKHGTVAKACEELRLAQPTISAQIARLERALGTKLFQRVGRAPQQVDEFLAAEVEPDAVARFLVAGMRPRPAAEAYLRRVGRPHAEQISRWLLETDLNLKGGSRTSERLLLEQLFLKLSGKLAAM